MTPKKSERRSHEVDLYDLVEHLKKRRQWLLTKHIDGVVAIELYFAEQERWQGLFGLYGLHSKTQEILLNSQTHSNVSIENIERVINNLIEIIEQQTTKTSKTTS